MTPESPARPDRRAWLALVVLMLPCVVVVMDLTVLFLAVPAITRDLAPSTTQLLWITDVYGFVVAASLITAGSLGDRYGRRRVLLTGGTLFALASAVAAAAPNAAFLIVARALQGFAGATLVPSVMALVFGLFPRDEDRTRAMAVLMSAFSAGGALGPVIGGFIIEWAGWRGVFLLNVPVMAVLLVAGLRLLPEVRDETTGGRFDVLGVGLCLAGILSFIYGVKHAAVDGVDLVVVLTVLAGLALLVAFVRRQRTLAVPVLDMRLFRNRAFSTGVGANVVCAFVMFGSFLFTTQYLQLALGLTPVAAALWSLPGSIGMVIVSNLTPRLVRVIRPGLLIAYGMGITAVGVLLLTGLRGSGDLWLVVVVSIVTQAGIAPGTGLLTQYAVGAAPAESVGSAAGASEASNELGGALGLALLGALAAAIYRHGVAGLTGPGPVHESFAGAVAAGDRATVALARSAFVDGVHAGAIAAAVLIAAMAVLVGTMLHNRPLS
jgi:DHA2 family multidrug resistance protein-like MFS transporter